MHLDWKERRATPSKEWSLACLLHAEPPIFCKYEKKCPCTIIHRNPPRSPAQHPTQSLPPTEVQVNHTSTLPTLENLPRALQAPFQHWTTLLVDIFPLISNLNFPNLDSSFLTAASWPAKNVATGWALGLMRLFFYYYFAGKAGLERKLRKDPFVKLKHPNGINKS